MGRFSKSSAERAEYRDAKAELATHTDPDSDKFVAANDRVVAAQKDLPVWHPSRRG
ncbi:hypothetical protein [Streptomyces sp. MMG1533]|uniref:hypothetical protein n=1 Tax=Streptomyces sp. MMG1533 TaxID=1415546 RepID=UPI000B14AC2D|nr:hypothetical protein [Streptomyces sp. MMG1533]